MKKIGAFLLLIVLLASAYMIFWTQYESGRISFFVGIGTIIGIFFVLSERITSAKTPFLELEAEIDKARSDVKEIGDILESIKSQKDMIDLIVRDANAAQKQMLQIETIVKEAHLKAQEIEGIVASTNLKAAQIEKIAKDANEKAKQADKDIKGLIKALEDAFR